MIKIKSIYLSAALIFFILLASFDVIFMRGQADFTLYLIYSVILSLAGYALNDVRTEKTSFIGLIFLVISAVMVSAGQYVFFFHHIPHLWIALLFLAAAFAMMIISGFYPLGDSGKKPLKFQPVEAVILVSILALAVFLRVYRAGDIPPGIWFDEAQNGNEVLRILRGSPLEIFIPRLTMMPAMYFYIAALFTKILGVNIEALRLVSVVTGVLSVAAFYFLCRQIFKDGNFALAGAFLLAASRWHITFSRVAFLGMLTLLLVITCFYFYLKALEGHKITHAALSGISMGLALYTFSGANFIPIILICHLVFLMLFPAGRPRKSTIVSGLVILLTAAAIASPLALYAVKNPEIFSKRFSDLTIANDIEKEKSLAPLFKSIKVHLLMFNFEGDYNGRHNLYKKPMLDIITGALLIAGFMAAITAPGHSFFIIWFFVMLLAGIMTISIEAPQSYRIIGILPVVYIFVLFFLKKAQSALFALSRAQKPFLAIFLTVLTAVAALNIRQYFVLYPKEEATYLSFSPEANAIARFISEYSEKYQVYVTTGEKLYGFYPWEQKLICDFVNYGRPGYEYLKDDNKVSEASLSGRRGVIILARPSDPQVIAAVEKDYPKAKKEEFINSVTDEIMFVCYYIEKEAVKKGNAIIHW